MCQALGPQRRADVGPAGAPRFPSRHGPAAASSQAPFARCLRARHSPAPGPPAAANSSARALRIPGAGRAPRSGWLGGEVQGLPIGWRGTGSGRRAPPPGLYSEAPAATPPERAAPRRRRRRALRRGRGGVLRAPLRRPPAGAGSWSRSAPRPGARLQAAPGAPRARHGVHHAAARGGARAVPRPRPALGGRGDPERERRLGPVLRLLRGAGAAAEGGPEARPGGAGEAAAGGQRPGAGPDPERQHRLHGAAHPHPHRAHGPEAVQDRDPPPGLQLHRPPGQRAAARGGLRGRAALLQRPLRRPRGAGRGAAPQHLHLLPQQPAQRGQPTGAGGQLPEGARGEPHAGAAEMSPSHRSICLRSQAKRPTPRTQELAIPDRGGEGARDPWSSRKGEGLCEMDPTETGGWGCTDLD